MINELGNTDKFPIFVADYNYKSRNMTAEEKALIKAKKIECWLGVFFLIPAILGAVAFILSMLGVKGDFVELKNLGYLWFIDYYQWGDGVGAGMSAAPIYMGMLAMVGAYLIKDSLKYLFMTSGEKKEVATETPKPEATRES